MDSHCGFAVLADTAAHDLDLRPQCSLGRRGACLVQFGCQRLRYPKRQRQNIYRWIRDLAVGISRGAGEEWLMPAAWREVAAQWLLNNEMTTIRKAGKVLPDFSLDLCQHYWC